MKRVIKSPSAFTLIEVMAVMVIIAILAGIVLGAAGYVQKRGAITATQSQIATIESAIERYKADFGAYPTGPISAVANALCPTSGTTKVYMTFRPQDRDASGNILDAFGTALNYQSPGSRNRATFDLWSSGPDRKTVTAADKIDDINNFAN